MALGLISAIRSLIEGDPSVRKVADDPALTAELLLLFRIILADGAVERDELEAFRRICRESFGIAEESFDAVLRYLKDFGYETDPAQAAAVFAEVEPERRRQLAHHIAEIAKADRRLDAREFRLIEKVADLLGLKPEDFAERPHPPAA